MGWRHFYSVLGTDSPSPRKNRPLFTLFLRNKMAHLYSQQGQNLNLMTAAPGGSVWFG